MVEIFEVADARHVLCQIINGDGALQRQVMQVVVKQHGAIAACGLADDFLMAGAGAMYQHPAVRAGAVDDAVIGEMATVIQHAGIDRLAGIELGNIAGGDVVEHGDGMRADEVDLFQARYIHQPRPGAHRDMFGIDILVIGPGGSHAAPVLEL